jgi:hypothetical protein
MLSSGNSLVSEVAGQLQGRLPGDLGDLGQGSLTLSWLEDTIEMLMARYNDDSDENGLARRRLSENLEKHLELISRLLCTAHRIYLCRAETDTDSLSLTITKAIGNSLTDPDKIIRPPGCTEELPQVAPDVIVQSPFWRFVVVPLLSVSSTPSVNLLQSAVESSWYTSLLECLERAVVSSRNNSRSTVARHLLQLVSVCASLFPAGACWTTNSHASWYKIPLTNEEENHLDARVLVPPRYIPGSSPEDLAVLLNTLLGVLELHGEMDGDLCVQIWVTRALEKLTLCTSSLSLLLPQKSMREPECTWRKVWNTIFRKDLRYYSSTSDCTPYGLGEAVSELVTAIARRMCADLGARWTSDLQPKEKSFLREHQGDLWSLPLFTGCTLHNCVVAAALCSSVILSVGLAEGMDSIGSNDRGDLTAGETRDRRSRLVGFFLRFLPCQTQDRAVVSELCHCLALLSHGFCDGGFDDDDDEPLTAVFPSPLPLPVPSTVPSQVFLTCLARNEKAVPSADLVGPTLKASLNERIWSHFDASLDHDAADSTDLQGQSSCLVAESTLLKLLPDESAKLRYGAFCANAAVFVNRMKAFTFSTTPPNAGCFEALSEIMRVVVQLGADFDLSTPDALANAAGELFEEFAGLLTEYPSLRHVGSKTSTRSSKLNFDSDEEYDTNQSPARGSKRGPPGADSQTAKRPRNLVAVLLRLQSIDVFCLADLLLLLRPSPKTLSMVIEGLTGASLDRLWVLQYDDIDPSALLYVMWLLARHNIPCEERKESSVINAFFEVSKAFRQTETAPVHGSVFIQLSCLLLVRRHLVRDESRSFTSEESAAFLSIWTNVESQERKILCLCPSFRSTSIRLASEMFLIGGTELRLEWGKAFPSLMLSGLIDRSCLVRRQSSYSIAQCITSTANEALAIESTLKSVYLGENFDKWYQSTSSKIDDESEQMWEDLSDSVFASSYLCLACIGGKTSSAVDQIRVYFHLVEMASRSPLGEGLCFLLIETMARLSGYESIEVMTSEFSDELLTLWFVGDKSPPTIEQLPLVLTSPGTVFFSLKTGVHLRFNEQQIEGIKSEAASDFATKSQWLFPTILSEASLPVLEDDGVRDFLSLYDNDAIDDHSLGKLVRQFLPGIFALVISLKFGSNTDTNKAKRLHSFVVQAVPKEKMDAVLVRCSRWIVSRLLSVAGSPLFQEKIDSSEYMDTILKFASQFGEPTNADPFFSIGSSCLEMLLFTSTILIRNQRSCRASLSLAPFLLIVDMISGRLKSGKILLPPVGFCLATAADLLARDFDESIHRGILQAAQHLLQNMLSSKESSPIATLSSDVTQDIEIFLVSSIALHERFQKRLLTKLRSSYNRLRRHTLSSMGIESNVDKNGRISSRVAADSFFTSEASYIDHLVRATSHSLVDDSADALLKTIHGFVTWLSENEQSLRIQCGKYLVDHLNEECSARDALILEKVNPKSSFKSILGKKIPSSTRKPSDIVRDIQRLISVSAVTLQESSQNHQVSPVARLLYTHLNQLSASLSSGFVLAESDAAKAFSLLTGLCSTVPKSIVAISVVCIGKLRKSIETTSVDSFLRVEENPFETDSSLGYARLLLEAQCVEVLAGALRASDLQKSTIACETLGIMLKRRQSAEFSRFLPLNTIELLAPFFSRKGHQTSRVLRINSEIVASLKDGLGGDTTWVDWCWNEDDWVKATDLSFEDWICLMVPAMLICREESKRATPSDHDSQEYLYRMAKNDALFAKALFPLCILDFVTDQSPTSECEDSSSVRNDTWIGTPDSKNSKFISRCFTALLSTYVGHGATDLRSVALILDTLEFMHKLTMARFEQSSHHCPNDRPKKQNQTVTAQDSLSSVSPPQTKRFSCAGVLYGVVIRLDGLLIARACLKVGRYASARFYAEAYADSRFGGPSNVLALLSEGFEELPVLSGDISGFGNIQSRGLHSLPADGNILGDLHELLDFLREATRNERGHGAETMALESCIADLPTAGKENGHRVSARSPTDELRRLGYETPSPTQICSIVESLSGLGIPSLVRSFIMGQSVLHDLEMKRQELSTRWYESCLEDPRLFDIDYADGNGFTIEYDRVSSLLPTGNLSFPEVFLSSLSSYVKDDSKTCGVRIDASREKISSNIVLLNSGESTWLDAHRILDQSLAVNDVESLIRSGHNRSDILASWSSGLPMKSTNPVWSVFPISDFAREVTARYAFQRARAGPIERRAKIAENYAELLWQMADKNRLIGNIDRCEALLTRLKGIESIIDGDHLKALRRSLLEADIHDARGDAMSAVQIMRQCVQCLNRNTSSTSHKEALAQGLIDLGARMAAIKVETGETILEEYFEPGLSMAKEQNSVDNSVRSRQILSSGHLVHADLLINLYQIVSARVSSPEWTKAEKSLEERERELHEMEVVMSAKLSKQKSQPKKKKIQPKMSPMEKDLWIYRTTVAKEVSNARQERRKIKDSVGRFISRAATSIVEALIISGADGNAASKYVYRLISIWFDPSSSAASPEMEDIFRSAVERIPSYRFVPLANQIFSRLGTPGTYSANLAILVRRMCCDHPYQCLPHIVRILGDDPGKDNIQLIKVKMAQEILAQVKGESRGFLVPLVEGYEILCASYIRFASVDVNNLMDKKRRIKMADMPRAARLDECLGKGSRRRPFPPGILSKPPPIRPSCDYDEVETVVGFDQSFTVAPSGLTRPKIVVCLGSKGSSYKQLVKGGDDCRGDSVMEQVFDYVNSLFRSQKILGYADLMKENKIQTYNIIPLNRKTGVSVFRCTLSDLNDGAFFLTK